MPETEVSCIYGTIAAVGVGKIAGTVETASGRNG
ncbi:hypothetical protein OROGR_016887 [Orobanche gracilis]